MQENSENDIYQASSAQQQQRLVIRVGEHSLSFLQPLEDKHAAHLPYIIKTGMSISANLRTAFREERFFEGTSAKALLSVCSPTVLVPLDEFTGNDSFNARQIYNYSITGHKHEEVVSAVLPDLNAVVLFAVNKDLKLVVTDRFPDVRVQNVMQPVWTHLYKRSMLVGQRRKLYVYFHDGMIDIFSFTNGRFKYANAFKAAHAHDALYFILFVWKQLSLDNEVDELHLVGSMKHQDWLCSKLKQFVRRVYVINPTSDLNRSPVSLLKDVEYDLMLS